MFTNTARDMSPGEPTFLQLGIAMKLTALSWGLGIHPIVLPFGPNTSKTNLNYSNDAAENQNKGHLKKKNVCVGNNQNTLDQNLYTG